LKTREEWQAELISRQDNVDPIRRIPNVALFNGTLIKGGQQWNKRQRFGALLLGIPTFAMGVWGVTSFVAVAFSARSVNIGITLWFLLFAPFSLWAGYRIISNAVFNSEKLLKKPRRP